MFMLLLGMYKLSDFVLFSDKLSVRVGEAGRHVVATADIQVI
jgi:hypothetical protein